MGEDYLRRAHTITPVENPYNLCDRTQESLFGAFDELRVGLVVHCPLAQGPAHGCLCEGRNLWGRRLVCLHGERRLDRTHGRAGGLPARAARAYAGTRGRALVLTGHFVGVGTRCAMMGGESDTGGLHLPRHSGDGSWGSVDRVPFAWAFVSLVWS